jgi:hypothetical protein
MTEAFNCLLLLAGYTLPRYMKLAAALMILVGCACKQSGQKLPALF